jgi:hypothetical protein
VANANRAPFQTIVVDSDFNTKHTCVVPHEAINKVYWATTGSTSKDAVLLFSLEVDGIALQREQAVSLLQLAYNKPNDTTIRQYVRMS